MKNEPTGFQVTFLLFALHVFAVVIYIHLAPAIGWSDKHVATLGNLIVIPMELALVFGLAPLRNRVLEALAAPLDHAARLEALATSVLTLVCVFGVWGAYAYWSIEIDKSADPVAALGLASGFDAGDQRYFSTEGMIRALFAVTLGPFAEEIIFRGVLYRLWEQQWGWKAGLLLSSLVFAASHPHTFAQTFIAGVLLGCVFRRTASLWGPILSHMFYNLLVTWPLFGQVISVRAGDSASRLDGWVPHLVCLAVTVVAVPAYVWHARRPRTPG